MPAAEDQKYTRSDLLNIATGIETAMKNYYTDLAYKFPNKKELLEAFAEEENGHILLTQSLLKDSEGDSDEEEKRRISGVISVFEKEDILPLAKKCSKNVEESKNFQEAMIRSAELERSVELFYCHTAMAFEPEVRRALYDLIAEEHKHRIHIAEIAERATEATG